MPGIRSVPYPCVVEAVTETTIMVAGVKIAWSTSLCLDFSILLPSSYKVIGTNSKSALSIPLFSQGHVIYTGMRQANDEQRGKKSTLDLSIRGTMCAAGSLRRLKAPIGLTSQDIRWCTLQQFSGEFWPILGSCVQVLTDNWFKLTTVVSLYPGLN